MTTRLACLTVAAFAVLLGAGAPSTPPGNSARAEVVVLLESPPLALAPATRTAVVAEQRTFRRELAAQLPEARVGWRYQLVANGFSLSVPSHQLPRLRGLPGVRDVLPASSYEPQLASSPQQIGAPALWGSALDTAGQGVRIGIIDSGVDPEHRFFDPTGYAMPPGFPKGQQRFTTAKVIVARVFAPKSATAPSARVAFSDDDSSHGTHVAGIAAGNADTSTGQGRVSGVAPRAYPRQLQGVRHDGLRAEPECELTGDRRRDRSSRRRWNGRDQLLGRRAGDRAKPGHRRARTRRSCCRRRRTGRRSRERLQRSRRRLRIVPRQLVTRHQRRRSRDQRQPGHEDTRRVLVGRTDDDLTAPQARRGGAGGGRAVVGPGQWLVGVLRDEHGGATHRRRGRPSTPAPSGVDGGAAQVGPRAIGSRCRRRAGSRSRAARPGWRCRRAPACRPAAPVRRAHRDLTRLARTRARRDEHGEPRGRGRWQRNLAGREGRAQRSHGSEARASGDCRRAGSLPLSVTVDAAARGPAISMHTSSYGAEPTYGECRYGGVSRPPRLRGISSRAGRPGIYRSTTLRQPAFVSRYRYPETRAGSASRRSCAARSACTGCD